MMTSRILPVAGMAAALIPAMLLLSAAPSRSASTAQGVYTEAQAASGAQLYSDNCAMCHGAMLQGTYEIPALRGRFIGNWGRAPLSSLYEYVSTAMPQFAPGSLSPEDNARIVAFLLKSNGMPAGPKPLPTDPAMLKAITFLPAGPAK